jgi:hypothetical protein
MNASVVRHFVIGILLAVTVAVAGCSHQARKVDCEGRLEAINVPARKPDAASLGPNNTAGPKGATDK